MDVTWSCNRYSNVALDVARARDVTGALLVALNVRFAAGNVAVIGTAAVRKARDPGARNIIIRTVPSGTPVHSHACLMMGSVARALFFICLHDVFMQ